MVVQRKLFEFNQVGKLLKRDPSTREAVVYEPDYNPDNIACNCVYCFRIRDSKLTLDVYLRSSDIAKLPYDVYTATRMLHSMADWVGNPELKAGSIWFIIGSLHKYVEEGYAKEV